MVADLQMDQTPQVPVLAFDQQEELVVAVVPDTAVAVVQNTVTKSVQEVEELVAVVGTVALRSKAAVREGDTIVVEVVGSAKTEAEEEVPLLLVVEVVEQVGSSCCLVEVEVGDWGRVRHWKAFRRVPK